MLNELRDLEQHRQQLQENIASASARIENLRQEESRVKTELERLKTSVEQVCALLFIILLDRVVPLGSCQPV